MGGSPPRIAGLLVSRLAGWLVKSTGGEAAVGWLSDKGGLWPQLARLLVGWLAGQERRRLGAAVGWLGAVGLRPRLARLLVGRLAGQELGS